MMWALCVGFNILLHMQLQDASFDQIVAAAGRI
jgi:hypothetical protein